MKIAMELTVHEMVKINTVLEKLGLKGKFQETDDEIIQENLATKVVISPLNFVAPFKVTTEMKEEFSTAILNVVIKHATPIKMLVQTGAAFLASMKDICKDMTSDFDEVKKQFEDKEEEVKNA